MAPFSTLPHGPYSRHAKFIAGTAAESTSGESRTEVCQVCSLSRCHYTRAGRIRTRRHPRTHYSGLESGARTRPSGWQAVGTFSQGPSGRQAKLKDSDITVAAVAAAAERGRIYVILPYSPCEKCESRDRLGREYNDSGIMNRLGKPQSSFRRMWILLPCLL